MVRWLEEKNLETFFDTENTEENLENTERSFATATHLDNESSLFSVHYVFVAIAFFMIAAQALLAF